MPRIVDIDTSVEPNDYYDLFRAYDDVNIHFEGKFKEIFKDDNKNTSRGIYHSTPIYCNSLRFAQFFFERGSVSRQLYQPIINTRAIDFGSYSKGTNENRALKDVLARTRGNEDISSPMSLHMYSLRESGDEDEDYETLESLGIMSKEGCCLHRSKLVGVVARETIYEEFSNLCELFYLKVKREDFEKDDVECIFRFIMIIGAKMALQTADDIRDFVKDFNLVEELGLSMRGLAAMIDDDVPIAVREIGFAIRERTPVRLAIFDGQHRADLYSKILNGLYDFTGNIDLEEISFNTAINTNRREKKVESWQELSLHKLQFALLFGTVRVWDERYEKMEEIHAPLSEYDVFCMYGNNINQASKKGLGVNPLKQAISEAVAVLHRVHKQKAHPYDSLEMVLKKRKGKDYFKNELSSLHKMVVKEWKNKRTLDSIVVDMKMRAGPTKIKEICVSLMSSPQPLIRSRHGHSVVQGVFAFLALCQLDEMGLQSLLVVLDDVVVRATSRPGECALPEFPTSFGGDNVMGDGDNARLFTSLEWIEEVLYGNFYVIAQKLLGLFVYEGAVLLQLKSNTDILSDMYKEETDSWDNLPMDYLDDKEKDLPKLFSVHQAFATFTDQFPTLQEIYVNDEKYGIIDKRIVRHLVVYLFIDVVGVIKKRGHDFQYSPVDKDGNPENVKNNFILDYLHNPKKKNYYQRTKKGNSEGWMKKYTMETFLYCWSTWLSIEFSPFAKPMQFKAISWLGGLEAPNKFKISPKLHEYSHGARDLSRFDKYRFSNFLERMLQPGGYEWFDNNGGKAALLYFDLDSLGGVASPKAAESEDPGDIHAARIIEDERIPGPASPEQHGHIGEEEEEESIAEAEEGTPAAKGSPKDEEESSSESDSDASDKKPKAVKRKSANAKRKRSSGASTASNKTSATTVCRKQISKRASKLYNEIAFGESRKMDDVVLAQDLNWLIRKNAITINFKPEALEHLNVNKLAKECGTVRNCFVEAYENCEGLAHGVKLSIAESPDLPASKEYFEEQYEIEAERKKKRTKKQKKSPKTNPPASNKNKKDRDNDNNPGSSNSNNNNQTSNNSNNNAGNSNAIQENDSSGNEGNGNKNNSTCDGETDDMFEITYVSDKYFQALSQTMVSIDSSTEDVSEMGNESFETGKISPFFQHFNPQDRLESNSLCL